LLDPLPSFRRLTLSLSQRPYRVHFKVIHIGMIGFVSGAESVVPGRDDLSHETAAASILHHLGDGEDARPDEVAQLLAGA
jgi:hypothetical protein